MKFCPTCETRYDEGILRFCTKDGTPLIDEDQPHFSEMPSESADVEQDDLGEETIIRRKTPPLNPPDLQPVKEDAPRIVIPMNAEAVPQQQVRSKTVVYQEAEPKKSNTAMIVLTTALLTLVVMGGMGALFWALRGDNGTNQNVNINTNPPDMNINTNLNNPLANFDYNTNTNTNVILEIPNLNLNTNTNVNLKSPTPTRTPSPSPSPTETPGANTNAGTNTTATPPPTATRPPAGTPTPPATPRNTPPATPPNNSSVSDVLKNGRKNLPKVPRIIRDEIPTVKLPKP